MRYELVCKAFTVTGPSITAVVEEWGKRKHGQPDYAAITIERIGPVDCPNDTNGDGNCHVCTGAMGRELALRQALGPFSDLVRSFRAEARKAKEEHDVAIEIDDESEDTVATRHIWLTYSDAATALETAIRGISSKPLPTYSVRRPVADLEVALKQCLHVIEKGIEVRMDEKWSVLRHMLPPAVDNARRALGLPPRNSGDFEAMDRIYGTGESKPPQ